MNYNDYLYNDYNNKRRELEEYYRRRLNDAPRILGYGDDEWQMKLMEDMKKRQEEMEQDPVNHCRICGNHLRATSDYFSDMRNGVLKTRLCQDCKDVSFETYIEHTNKGDSKKCQKCMSHPSACTCPERKVLKKIRK